MKKIPRYGARILAAHMVSVCEEGIGKTATNLMQSERRVRDWLKRYDGGVLDGLRDLPGWHGYCGRNLARSGPAFVSNSEHDPMRENNFLWQ